MEADEGGEGWVTASQAAPGAAAAGATTTNEDGFEEIPSVDEAAGGSGGTGAGDAAAAGGAGAEEGADEEGEEEDVPDIADLELEEEEEEDEVNKRGLCKERGLQCRWAGGCPPAQMIECGVGCSCACASQQLFGGLCTACHQVLSQAARLTCLCLRAYPALPAAGGSAAGGGGQRRRSGQQRWGGRRRAHPEHPHLRFAHHLRQALCGGWAGLGCLHAVSCASCLCVAGPARRLTPGNSIAPHLPSPLSCRCPASG